MHATAGEPTSEQLGTTNNELMGIPPLTRVNIDLVIIL